MTTHVSALSVSWAIISFSLLIIVSPGRKSHQSRDFERRTRSLEHTTLVSRGDNASSQGSNMDDSSRILELNVAFCFVGQFIRNSMMDSPVRLKFGNAPKRYDAFVSSSDQHDEQSPLEKVNSTVLCQGLHALGFDACQIYLQPYNASIYHAKVAGLEDGMTNRFGLYPHRIASLFSTVSKSLDLVMKFEDKKDIKYDFVFVTRLDVVNIVRFSGIETKLKAKEDWWAAAGKYELVAAKLICEQNLPCFDDRFWFGKRDSVMAFQPIYKRFRSVYQRAWSCWPERMLRVFADSYVLKNTYKMKQEAENDNAADVSKYAANIKLPPPEHSVRKRLSPPQGVALVSDFVDLTNFNGFTSKYGPAFLRQALSERKAADLTPLVQGNKVEKKRAVHLTCTEFKFSFARTRCEMERKKETASTKGRLKSGS